MTTNKPEVIYLINTGDGTVWCDDPDHMGCGERIDTVKYVRGDAYEALQAECDALRAKTSISLGVGDGTGNHFIHGNYESIKRAQALIFECGKLRKDVDMLVDALKCLYDAIDSCIELTPDIMRKAEAALAPHRKQGGGV